MSVLGLRSLSNELRSQSFKIEKVRKENFGAVNQRLRPADHGLAVFE